MKKIRIGIVGVGNCASSLLQGIRYYEDIEKDDAIGLMHWDIGGFKPFDIEVVAAFDIDHRKVGREVGEAIFSKPNCTTVFCEDVATPGVTVSMGRILDGLSKHMMEKFIRRLSDGLPEISPVKPHPAASSSEN